MSQYVTKPNFEFFDAYRERTEFFINEGDQDLEDMTRIHFCKSLLLTYGNKSLDKCDKNTLYELFSDNFKKIHKKNLCETKIRVLFNSFYFIPSFTSRVAQKVKG